MVQARQSCERANPYEILRQRRPQKYFEALSRRSRCTHRPAAVERHDEGRTPKSVRQGTHGLAGLPADSSVRMSGKLGSSGSVTWW